jgi:hypothetical protein
MLHIPTMIHHIYGFFTPIDGLLEHKRASLHGQGGLIENLNPSMPHTAVPLLPLAGTEFLLT